MEFDVNSWVIYLIVILIILAVMGQAVFFLVRALKRAKKIGVDKTVIKKTIITASIFTIAPAIAIVVGIIALTKSLGVPLPWLRLSVIGSLSYETVAAQNALSGMNMTFGDRITSAEAYVTVVFVMTISIMSGLLLAPLIGKKLQNGMVKLGKKDKKWSVIFQNSLFIGMIAAFLGYVFCDVSTVFNGETYGLIPVLVMAVSAITMCLCGLLLKITKIRVISDYALPISMIVGMVMAIPLTSWLG